MNRCLARSAAIALTLALGLSACTHGSPAMHTPATGSTVFRAPVQLSGKQQQFGTSATPQAGVTYQPDVVFVGGGADAVRSVSQDGLVWTVDGHAPGVADLATGKIMVATSFGAGRVLALGSAGPDVQVALGPVTLTDIYRDADLGSATPIPVRNVYAYPTPTGDIAALVTTPEGSHTTNALHTRPLTHGARPRLPFPTTVPTAVPTSVPSVIPTSVPTSIPTTLPGLPSIPSGVPLPSRPSAPVPTVSAAGFTLSPFWNATGLGVRIGYHHQDGNFLATLTLHMDAPSTSFRVAIRNGRLVEASVGLRGAVSISLDVEAASMSTAGSFKTAQVPVPVNLSIPLGGLLSLSLTQTFSVSMQFLGQAKITSHGKYTVRGELGFGYRNGSIFGGAVTDAIVEPITDNTKSYGIAATAFRLTWSPKISIEVGLGVFSAGLSYILDLGVGVAADTPLDALGNSCVRDSLLLSSRYGYGWQVLGVVMDVVNAVISIVGAKKLPSSGGRWWGPTTLWKPKPGDWCPK